MTHGVEGIESDFLPDEIVGSTPLATPRHKGSEGFDVFCFHLYFTRVKVTDRVLVSLFRLTLMSENGG